MKYTIVGVDTNWAEVEPLATITKRKTTTFVENNIIYWFGIPRILIVDNREQFDNVNFKEFCANLSINLRFISLAHPKANGQVEAVNKIISKALKK